MDYSTNQTSVSPPFQYYIYMGQGLALLLANGLIVGAIAKYDALRSKKEYIVVAGLAFVDAITGLAYFLAGAMRSYVIMTGQAEQQVSSWRCMLWPFNFLFMFAMPMSGVMLVCASVDRLFAVLLPIKYYKWRMGYAKALVGSCYIYGVLNTLLLMLTSYLMRNERTYGLVCMSPWAIGNEMMIAYYGYMPVIGGIVHVVLYLAVPVLYKRHRTKITGQAKNMNQEADAKFQKRLIVTQGISAFFTFLFFVLGNLGLSLLNNNELIAVFGPATAIYKNLNPLLNVFLYSGRHKDMKNAIRGFITCKETLPNDNVTNVAPFNKHNKA